MAEARKRVLLLYADWLRAVPRAVRMYRLDTTVEQARKVVRTRFEREFRDPINADLDSMHQLTVRATMDLIELWNRWAQRPHVVHMFGPPHSYITEKDRLLRQGASPFLADFLSKSQ